MMEGYAGSAVAAVIPLTHLALRRPAHQRTKLDLSPPMYYEFEPIHRNSRLCDIDHTLLKATKLAV